MSTRRARVDALTDDVATLVEKVQELHEDLERALEEADGVEKEAVQAAVREAENGRAEAPGQEAEQVQTVVAEQTAGGEHARADGGNVGWSEIETAGPDGAKEVEEVEWTPIETE